MRHCEDKEQEVLFEWASYHPTLRCMFAIANGGNRNVREAARLKKQGVKAGVSDIFLPIPSGGYHGMFIELKRRKVDGPSKVSRKQLDFMETMEATGYRVAVCYGADFAIAEINQYLAWD